MGISLSTKKGCSTFLSLEAQSWMMFISNVKLSSSLNVPQIKHLYSASDGNFYDACEPKSRQEVHRVCF